MSSRYAHECVPGHEDRLPEGMPTVATVFAEHGYETAYFGKWHLDGFKERTGRAAHHVIPPERRGGFEHWLGYENNNSQWDSWVHSDKAPERLDGYETDVLSDRMINFISGRKPEDERPFFAVLSVQPPHDPYVAPGEWLQRHNPADIKLRPNVPTGGRTEEIVRRELAGYYAMIENLDWNVGRIVEALRRTGQLENTHILFFSDHGDMHGSHGLFRKTMPHEESISIPLLISGHGSFYYGRHGNCDRLISLVDLAPTSLGLCGIDPPPWMRGFNHAASRTGNPEPAPDSPESVFLQLVKTSGRGEMARAPWRGIVTADGWKYAAFESGPWLLFDLNEDPYELANLAHFGKSHSRLKLLNDQLRAWCHAVEDNFSVPDI